MIVVGPEGITHFVAGMGVSRGVSDANINLSHFEYLNQEYLNKIEDILSLLWRILLFYLMLCNDDYHLCNDNYHLCNDDYHLCNDDYHLCNDDYHLCNDNYHLCNDDYHLCNDDYHLCNDDYHLCNDDYHLCNDDYHLCNDDSFRVQFSLEYSIGSDLLTLISPWACI